MVIKICNYCGVMYSPRKSGNPKLKGGGIPVNCPRCGKDCLPHFKKGSKRIRLLNVLDNDNKSFNKQLMEKKNPIVLNKIDYIRVTAHDSINPYREYQYNHDGITYLVLCEGTKDALKSKPKPKPKKEKNKKMRHRLENNLVVADEWYRAGKFDEGMTSSHEKEFEDIFGKPVETCKKEFNVKIFSHEFEGMMFYCLTAKGMGSSYEVDYQGDLESFRKDRHAGSVCLKFLFWVQNELKKV